MRFIEKGDEPEDFATWKRRNPNANWSDFSASKDVSTIEIYNNLRESLLLDQELRCCYCEMFLNKNEEAHVEHLKDKDRYPKEKFLHSNLLASCKSTTTCGHKKDKGYFEQMITPLLENCQDRLMYTDDGRIIARDENDEDARRTIEEVLNLNHKRLVDRRKTIIRGLEQYGEEMFDQCFDNCDSWFGGFPSLIEYYISQN
ncbi:MAG: TIGR02646 family protein [Marinifilum sp.]|jgi:uncharacterized protein (TIGR02646 family)|nr:TIGR02646 family protein [Marinifilum sp.]